MGYYSAKLMALQKSYLDGLILSYDFNGNTNDTSPNGIHGSLVGAATILNNRLNISGAGQNLTIPDNDLLSFGLGAFSFSFKVLITSMNAYNFIITKRDDNYTINNSKTEWQIYFSSGKLNMMLFDTSKSTQSSILCTSIQTFSINTEYNIVITFSGGVGNYFKIYSNGVQIAHTYTTAGIYEQMRNTASSVCVGAPGFNISFLPLYGYLDNIKIYNKELTVDEVFALNV